ncbi:MAG TPA: hypothetical protein P5107_12600 [Thermotogota bacterium]|nr:hypothetical protein [Thermotogota bacterium]
MKNSLLILIWIISIVIFILGGLLNPYFFLMKQVDYPRFLLFALIAIVITLILAVVLFKGNWRVFLFEVFFLLILYPFSLLFLLPYFAHRKDDSEIPDPFFMGDFSSRKRGVNKFLKEKFDTVPLKFLLFNTEDSNIKKKSVLDLKSRILDASENKQIKEHIKLLKLARSDPHPDVALYASDAITEIEEYYEDKIVALHAELPETAKDYADAVLTYLDSEIPKGAIARFFARDAVGHLKESIGESYNKQDFYIEASEIYSKAGLMEEQIELLREGFDKTGDLNILKRQGLIEYALGNLSNATRLHREFSEKGGEYWFASGNHS